MSKGKKSATYEKKEQRKLAEILKAQASVRGYIPTFSVNVKSDHKVEKKEEKFLLPISDIKKDLIKNAAFAIFSVIVIVILSKTGFGLEYFSKVVKF